MATARNITSPRRSFIALMGAAGGVLAAPPTALAVSPESEPLVEMWARLKELEAAYAAADEADWAARRKRPDCPQVLLREVRPIGGPAYYVQLQREHLSAEQVLVLDEWEQACEASDVLNGVDALSEIASAAAERHNLALEEILRTPPRTIAGFGVLVEIIDDYDAFARNEAEEDRSITDRLFQSLVAAVRGLAPPQRTST